MSDFLITQKSIFTVYTKQSCPYCVKAKHLLDSKGLSYTEVEIGVGITRESIVEQFPIMKTVPIITVDGRLIGGFQQLNQLNEEGNLP